MGVARSRRASRPISSSCPPRRSTMRWRDDRPVASCSKAGGRSQARARRGRRRRRLPCRQRHYRRDHRASTDGRDQPLRRQDARAGPARGLGDRGVARHQRGDDGAVDDQAERMRHLVRLRQPASVQSARRSVPARPSCARSPASACGCRPCRSRHRVDEGTTVEIVAVNHCSQRRPDAVKPLERRSARAVDLGEEPGAPGRGLRAPAPPRPGHPSSRTAGRAWSWRCRRPRRSRRRRRS